MLIASSKRVRSSASADAAAGGGGGGGGGAGGAEQRVARANPAVSPEGVPAALVALHGVQLLLGYLLMLVAMTYSVELLLCTCAGLAAGCADRAARAEPSLRILGLSESSAPRSPLGGSRPPRRSRTATRSTGWRA